MPTTHLTPEDFTLSYPINAARELCWGRELAMSSLSSRRISHWGDEDRFGRSPMQISVRVLCLSLAFFPQTLLRCVCAVFEACWRSLPWCSWHPRSITGRSTWKHLKGKPRGGRSSRLSSLLDIGWPSTAPSQWSSFILYLSTESHGDFQMPCVLIQFSSGYHNIDMVI